MLKLFYAMSELDFSQLTQVYTESLHRDGEGFGSGLSEYQDIRYAEDALYESVLMLFQTGGIFAVWIRDNMYVSAVRLETYQDGYLVAGLETAPLHRGKGFAGDLLNSVCLAMGDRGITTLYSHVKNANRISARVHEKCGFVPVLDHAVFLDGSVDTRSKTYLRKL